MNMSQEVFHQRKSISAYWHNKATDLHASAGVLWRAIEAPLEEQTAFSYAVACWPVYQMLCGMSLELLFKATIVATGKEPKTTHKLVNLAEAAGVVFEPKDIALLKILSESVIWDGRYPVPKEEGHYQMLNDLHWEHLHDHVPGAGLDIRRQNDNLAWESFNRMWRIGSELYWAHC